MMMTWSSIIPNIDRGLCILMSFDVLSSAYHHMDEETCSNCRFVPVLDKRCIFRVSAIYDYIYIYTCHVWYILVYEVTLIGVLLQSQSAQKMSLIEVSMFSLFRILRSSKKFQHLLGSSKIFIIHYILYILCSWLCVVVPVCIFP